MSPDELSGPDLSSVVADANAVGLEHVVIGGFAVIFHGLRKLEAIHGPLPTDPIPGLDT